MMKSFMSRVISGMMIAILIISSCAGCSSGSEESALTFTAMDTVMSLSVSGADGACESIRALAEQMDARLSAVDENSEIFALNRSGAAELNDDTAALVSRALELCAETGGAFDITVYHAVEEWGFTNGEYKVPDDSRLNELAAAIDYTAVTINGNTAELPDGVKIDLGAVAKGRLADGSRELLAESGADCAVLNLGGTILLYGKKPDGSPFRVGIADPGSAAAYFGTLSLSGGVVSTSGGYERYFEKDGRRYIHILDPDTAKPVDNGILSVTVITDEGAKADALSTALFVMGIDGAAEYCRVHPDFDCVILTADGKLYMTEGAAQGFAFTDGYDYEIEIIGGQA